MRYKYTISLVETADGCLMPNLEPLLAKASELLPPKSERDGDAFRLQDGDEIFGTYKTVKTLRQELEGIRSGTQLEIFRNALKTVTIIIK